MLVGRRSSLLTDPCHLLLSLLLQLSMESNGKGVDINGVALPFEAGEEGGGGMLLLLLYSCSLRRPEFAVS